jgi:hypothetical protein
MSLSPIINCQICPKSRPDMRSIFQSCSRTMNLLSELSGHSLYFGVTEGPLSGPAALPAVRALSAPFDHALFFRPAVMRYFIDIKSAPSTELWGERTARPESGLCATSSSEPTPHSSSYVGHRLDKTRSADLFFRSLARVPWLGQAADLQFEPRTYRTGPRYVLCATFGNRSVPRRAC